MHVPPCRLFTLGIGLRVPPSSLQISKTLLNEDARLRLPRFLEDEAPKDPEATKQVRWVACVGHNTQLATYHVPLLLQMPPSTPWLHYAYPVRLLLLCRTS